MLISTDQVKVSDRIRKDFGDIEELAQDIAANGLINPPVVTPDFVLIAGERRLRACKHLGWQQIEVRVMTVRDYEHQLRMEISENENRKEFTFSERVEWARRLEQVERLKAKARQGARTDLGYDGVDESLGEGRSRDIVAAHAGFGSGESYRKARYVAENGGAEIIEQLDQGEISLHRAYEETRRRLAEVEQELLETRKLAEKPPQVVEVIREVVPKDIDSVLQQSAEQAARFKQQLQDSQDRLRTYEQHIMDLKQQLEGYRQTSEYDHLSPKAASYVDRQLEITSECNALAEKLLVLTMEVPDDLPGFVREVYKKAIGQLARVSQQSYDNLAYATITPVKTIIDVEGEFVHE